MTSLLTIGWLLESYVLAKSKVISGRSATDETNSAFNAPTSSASSSVKSCLFLIFFSRKLLASSCLTPALVALYPQKYPAGSALKTWGPVSWSHAIRMIPAQAHTKKRGKFVLFNNASRAQWFLYHWLLEIKCMVIVTYFIGRNTLFPHKVLFLISSKIFYMHFPTDRTGQNIPQPLMDQLWTSVVTENSPNCKCICCAGSIRWSKALEVGSLPLELRPTPPTCTSTTHVNLNMCYIQGW